MDRKYFIYLLLHPVFFYPFYVGLSHQPNERYEQGHAKDRDKRRFGLRPHLLVVGLHDTIGEVRYAENVWIDMLNRLPLLTLANEQGKRLDTDFTLTWWVWPMVRLVWHMFNMGKR